MRLIRRGLSVGGIVNRSAPTGTHVAALLVVLACIGGAMYVRTWEVPYLVWCGSATLAVGAAAFRARGRSGWVAALGCVVLTALCLLAERSLRGLSLRRTVRQETSREDLRRAVSQVAVELGRSATRIAQGGATNGALPSTAHGEIGAAHWERGKLMWWSGIFRMNPALLRDSLGAEHNEFYTVVYARRVVGEHQALVALTLDAEAPADRLARAWTGVIARQLGLESVRVVWGGRGADVVDLTPSLGLPLALRQTTRSAEVDRVLDEERHRTRVLAVVAALLLLGLGMVWRASPAILGRLAALGGVGVAIGVAPLSALSNVASVFNPGYYYSSLGGPWTASIGALAMTGALLCLAVFAVVRGSQHFRRPPAWVGGIALACVGGGPFLLRALARGLTLPPRGAPGLLWVAWQVALFLVAAGLLLLAWWSSAQARRRGLPHGAALGSGLAACAALAAPWLVQAPARFPPWYPALWIAAMGALVFSRRARALPVHVAFVAACGATTLVWGSIARKRIDLAERDVAGLTTADAEVRNLLVRLAERIQQLPPPRSAADLLKVYVGSELPAAGNPVELATWSLQGESPVSEATVQISDLSRRIVGLDGMAKAADSLGQPLFREFGSPRGVQLAVGIPLDSGHALTVAVGPRSRLIADDPFAALLGLDVPNVAEPPYTLTVGPGSLSAPSASPNGQLSLWVRRGDELHRDWQLEAVLGSLRAHVEVDLRSFDALVARGTLLVVADLAVFAVLWLLLVASDLALRRWLRARTRRARASYRARLTVALVGAFVLPAVTFAIWTRNRLRVEDDVSRSLLVQELLRTVRYTPRDPSSPVLEGVDVPAFAFRDNVLISSRDSLHAQLVPIGWILDPDVSAEVVTGLEETTNTRHMIAGVSTLIGYRALGNGTVLAVPARRSDLTLDRQQRDVIALLAFAMVCGSLVALWLSGVAARALASPVAALRRAASDVATGARELPSLGEAPLSEFSQVFSTFRQMAVDLSDSRQALDAARQRTEAVLRDVASGVVALGADGRVVLANPQAERMFGAVLSPGDTLDRTGVQAIGAAATAFLRDASEQHDFAVELRGRDLRLRLTRLSRGSGGAVLTVDDVTDIARAQRVFAWGEMARQVAHEIKNPLTPIRLGVQHVRRAHADHRSDFSSILDRNVDRILQEIDRLDEIARSFARFGLTPEEAQLAEPIDVGRVLADVVELERLGEGNIAWELDVPDALYAQSREGELREVLLNLLENARHAHASRVRVWAARDGDYVHVHVTDDGDGIPPEVLPRVFEPQFSTRTSGSGLGLAICKRLVESWGGRIRAEPIPPRGTQLTITLVRALTR